MVFLFNPPIYNASNIRKNEFPFKKVLPNIELGYMASVLEASGHNVQIEDCPANNIPTLNNYNFKVINENDIVIVFIYNHTNILETARFIKNVRQLHLNNTIICGGKFFSIDAKRYMSLFPDADIGVASNDYNLWSNLIDCIESKGNLTNIDDTLYDNKIIYSLRKEDYSLDDLPLPKRSSTTNEVSNVLVSSGCNGCCTFCALHLYNLKCGVKARKRNPQKIWEEIDELYKKGVKYVVLESDDLFSFNVEDSNHWISDFCECSKNRNYDLKFHAYLRADNLLKYKEYLPFLKKAGLCEVFVGIESFCDRQLKLYSKHVSAKNNINAFKILKKSSLDFEIGAIIFEPTVTPYEILLNYQIIKKLKYYKCNGPGKKCISLMSDLTLIKDTKLEKTYQKKGINTQKSFIEFMYSKSKEIHKIKNEWCTKLIQVQELDNCICYEKNKISKKNLRKITKLKRKLIKIDLDYMIKISHNIIHERSTAKTTKIYEKKLNKLKKQFQKYL